MLQLTNKILDLSRIEADQIEAYPEGINVLVVVNSCAKMSGLSAKKAGIDYDKIKVINLGCAAEMNNAFRADEGKYVYSKVRCLSC